ncbi:Signal transduction histidine kinase [Catalinimonas alkaloidigena]|uniref:histidine kinase n=2 Tax=Catalinimonas alkaloidigena TaxID=1075417 RepID=A0A1G9P4A7_9BACT|nr:Signal transduction histidine kinase [Catalinimonas alkaloidigena]
MINKRFILLTILAFVSGTFILLLIQFNSYKNINRLISGNERLLRELRLSNYLRELERDIIWVESRNRAAIATDDPSHIEGVEQKIAQVQAYLDTLEETNDDDEITQYINMLRVHAAEKLEVKNQLLDSFRLHGTMDDTVLIANPRARQVSNEISLATQKIYDSRQHLMLQLSDSIEEMSLNARSWSSILIGALVVSAVGWCWFIFARLQQQNRLIVQLNVSEKKALAAAQVKENFMANMSHEIRTPLNVILGFTNLLRMQPLDTQAKEFVTSIQKAGENLLAIVNDILDLAKLEAGMMRIEARPFHLRSLLHSLEMMFQERVEAKGLSFQVQIDPKAPDQLVGDPTRLTQVLVNLIGNALKFTPEGHIAIQVAATPLPEARVQMHFEISDTGIGIEREKLATIFERFQQADDSTSRNYGGTGLGLSIVKDLIQLQGGEIQVASETGRGTTFRFFVPYKVAEPLPPPAPALEEQVSPLASAQLRLLVVDDNEMNRSLMHYLLSQWQLQFDTVANGEEAILLVRQHSYDLILMDIQMPRMDGYAATQYIRSQLKSTVPIVAMTAHALAGEREKCLRMGMDDYLTKPIDEQKLFEVITQLTRFRARQEPARLPGGASDKDGAYQYINLTYLRSISKENVAYMKNLSGLFLEVVDEELEHLITALQQKDSETIRQVAHKMKTSVSVMGLLESLEPMLDALEYHELTPDEREALATRVIVICQHALQEAKLFYDSL